MNKYIILIVLLFLPGCITVNVSPGFQDMRDPVVRTQVDELITSNAEKDRLEPQPRAEVFEKYTPDMQCENMQEPERVPIVAQPELILKAWADHIEGVPTWIDEVQWPDCDVGNALPTKNIAAYGLVDSAVYLIFYDLSGDEQIDATIEIYNGELYPTFYSFDLTGNGQPNITYTDTLRDGTCNGVEAFQTAEDNLPADLREQTSVGGML